MSQLPLFRQMNPHGFYYDDTLYPEGTEFHFTDTPNDWLEPLNEAAREAKDKWCDEQDELHRKYCEKVGRMYTPRPRDWREGIAMLREDVTAEVRARDEKKSSKLQPTRRAPVPPQGHLRPAANGESFSAAKRPNQKSSKISNVREPAPVQNPEAKPIAILGKNFDESLAASR